MNTDFFINFERLLSATANGVYQGLLVALFAGLVLGLLGRTNAATRHAVWFGVLLFVAALIPAHLLLSLRPNHEILTAAQRPDAAGPVAAPTPSAGGINAAAPIMDAAVPDVQSDESVAAGIMDEPRPAVILPPAERAEAGLRPRAEATAKTWWSFAPAILKPQFWKRETAVSLPHAVCVGLVSVWALLAGIRGWAIARGIGEVRRAKAASNPPSERLQTVFDQLRPSPATKRAVRLRLSDTRSTAVVLGFVHPAILLPAEMDDANDREVEQVLRHELAHVDRRDDWGNLAQQIIQAALFFHPAVWWISARLSLEREIACDDRVLEDSVRPRDYALTLANVAGRMVPGGPALAPGVSSNHSQLKQRINMILNTRRNRSARLARSRMGFVTLTTAMLAILAVGAGPRLVLAQSAAPAPKIIADGTPATLPSDGPAAESGPRLKLARNDRAPRPAAPEAPAEPGEPPAPPSASVLALVAPVAVSADVAVAADVAPSVQVHSVPAVPPMAPTPQPARPRKRSASVEERLDRIESMLAELEARDGVKARRHNGDMADPKVLSDYKRNADDAKRMSEDTQRAVQAGQLAAQAGQRAAEASQRSVEMALRDIGKLKNNNLDQLQARLSELDSQVPAIELEALRQARESLAKQMQSIERQIRRLEENQNRPKKAGNHSDNADEAPPQPK